MKYYVEFYGNEHDGLDGFPSYSYCTVPVEANSLEEAIEKALPLAVYRTYCGAYTQEDVDRKEAERVEAQRKKDEKKARRLANEQAKAEALGMSYEAYKALCSAKRKVEAYRRQIAEDEQAILELQAHIGQRKADIAELLRQFPQLG